MSFLRFRGSRAGLFYDLSAGEFCPLRHSPPSVELRFPPQPPTPKGWKLFLRPQIVVRSQILEVGGLNDKVPETQHSVAPILQYSDTSYLPASNKA
jgi:hypothetical protein